MGCQCTKTQYDDDSTNAGSGYIYFLDKHRRIVSVPCLRPVDKNELYSSRIKKFIEYNSDMKKNSCLDL